MRILVAMSGGVDSSVVAGLLARQGHDVIGVTLQLYDHGAALGRKGACCAGQDIRDARDVAARLGIAHYVLDYESRFRDAVIADFADSYARGETPVPCIQCNRSVKFQCEHVHVRVEQTDTPFTGACATNQILRLPIAHGEGNYYAEPSVIDGLERNRQVIFRYVDPAGQATDVANPNGSIHNIAGICSETRNVVGLMPHPERACESALGSADGLVMFESVVRAVSSGAYTAGR